MDKDNVVQIPEPMDRIGARIDAGFARARNGDREWIEGSLEAAQGLVEARNRFSDHIGFNRWLLDNGHDHVNKDDRAALINMGQNPRMMCIVLEETDRRSYQLIWLENKNRFLSAKITTEKDRPTPETAPTPSTALLGSVSTNTQTDQKPLTLPQPRHEVTTGGGGNRMKNPANAELVKLLKIPVEHYVAVMGAYQYNRQRILKTELTKLAKKRGGKKSAVALFARAFEVVRTGKAPVLNNRDVIDARIFLPDVPEGFCKSLIHDNSDLSKLVQRIDRLDLLNGKAAELAAANTEPLQIHNELSHIWETGEIRPPPVAKVVHLAPDDSKNQIKHKVTYCDDVIWPNHSLKHVTLADLNMGWHIADHLLKRTEVATPLKPNEVLVEVMQLIQDLCAASSLKGVTDVMSQCVQAYARRNQRRDKADFTGGMPPGKPR